MRNGCSAASCGWQWNYMLSALIIALCGCFVWLFTHCSLGHVKQSQFKNSTNDRWMLVLGVVDSEIICYQRAIKPYIPLYGGSFSEPDEVTIVISLRLVHLSTQHQSKMSELFLFSKGTERLKGRSICPLMWLVRRLCNSPSSHGPIEIKDTLKSTQQVRIFRFTSLRTAYRDNVLGTAM